MKLKQFDVKTAFLNGDLHEDIYMRQPIGFDDGTNRVCKLKKGLYGLKQASRCWNKKFKHFIELFGFVATEADSCVFTSHKNNQLIILAIHVDDGLIAGDNEQCVESVIGYLKEKFEIRIMNAGCFLGVEIEQIENGSIFIHQSSYAKRVLKRFNMIECNPVSTPSDNNQQLAAFEDSSDGVLPYRELIGSLMYLAVGTRPDIMHAVSVASRYMERPKMIHEKAAKRILRYLKRTINLGILYSSGDSKISAYTDADYGGDVDTRRSTSGYAFMFNSGIITWNSERQKSVALSTMESEYMAASNAVKELIRLKGFVQELLGEKNIEIDFYMDNQSAIKLIKNP